MRDARVRRSLWFGTLQFNHFNLGRKSTINAMQHEAERVYRGLLTNLVRNPRKARSGDLPIFVGCPDSQVLKRKPTGCLAEMLPNEGMHYHFILAVPAITRLKMPLNLHVQQKMEVYLGSERRMSNFDILPLVQLNDTRIVDYMMKHIKRGTYSSDDILILPKNLGEL